MEKQQHPTRHKHFVFLAILILAVGLALRLIDLDRRPMHGDEAVNAAKLNQLMQSGTLEYDPAEYHGPLFYYLSWPFLALQGKTEWRTWSESDLRLVSVFFGLLLVALPLLLRPFLNERSVLLAMLLAALSPVLIFYNRYYIHETLFVFWLYLSLFLFLRSLASGRLISFFLAGLSLGLSAATKETWIIFAFSVFLSVLLLKKSLSPQWMLKTESALVFFVGWALAVGLLFSAFLQNMNGLFKLSQSFGFYVQRGMSGSVHAHPWFQYVKWLCFYRSDSFWWASQWLPGLLFFWGLFGLALRKISEPKRYRPLLFLAVTALLCAIIFSALPYKTPWNVLPFWIGMLMVAGWALSFLWQQKPLVGKIVLLFLILHFSWQFYWQNFKKETSIQNPFVYAQPTKEVLKLAQTVDALWQHMPDSTLRYLQVMVPHNDYWPLPWYLRQLSRVGWWAAPPQDSPPAPLIIADISLESELIDYLYNRPAPGQRKLYIPYFQQPVSLRPGRPLLQLYVQKEFLDRMTPHEQ